MNPALADPPVVPPRSRVRGESRSSRRATVDRESTAERPAVRVPVADAPPADGPPWRDDVVTLRNVPWELYESLRDLPGNRAARFTFDAARDGGLLEIVMPGLRHERTNSVLRMLLETFLTERGRPFLNVGQMTLRQMHRRGAEADTAFYLEHWDAVADAEAIDLDRDPPPDLAVEVVETHDLGPIKESVYARLGVPELWVYRRGTLAVRLRTADGSGYEDAAASLAVPDFPFALAQAFAGRRGVDHGTLTREFREAVRPAADR